MAKAKHRTSVVAIANHKGGVAKTTSTYFLANVFARRGQKVLVVDLDPQGNSSLMLGVREIATKSRRTTADALASNHTLREIVTSTTDDNIDVLASDMRLGRLVRIESGDSKQHRVLQRLIDVPERYKYDIILVDTPPYLGSLLTSALEFADYVLTPVTVDKFSLEGIEDLMAAISNARQINPQLVMLGVFAVKFGKSSKHQRYFDNIRKICSEEFNIDVLNTTIPESAAACSMTYREEPLRRDVDGSANYIVPKYDELAGELLPHLRGKRTGRVQAIRLRPNVDSIGTQQFSVF